MKFSEHLFSEVKEIWDGYFNHPFIKELAEGTLPKEKFKNYLIQDYLYLKEYAKVFALGVVKSETVKEMNFFNAGVVGILEDEAAVHIKYLSDFGINKDDLENYHTHIVNSSYVSYMQAVGLQGGLKEIAATILPCAWSYNLIGKYIEEKYESKMEGNFYYPWIQSYSSKEFTEGTNLWIDYVDMHAEKCSEAEKKKLIEIFVKSSIYEMQFWDMAYEN